MRIVPRRRLLVTIAVLALAFFGAAGLGLALTERVAPGSHVAALLSFLLLPAALILGFYAWLGVAVLIAAPRLVAALVRGGPRRPPIESHQTVVPPGEWIFLPIASGLALPAGLVVGMLSPDRAVWAVGLLYWAIGTAYGASLWGLARHGYLPFPDSA
ncbi:MAG TPA: hypothetical protein VNC82_10005 [Candidatus Limnocylindria bacterium]|nr:hypothetical protein [Candidatus Limnocylindria bacterium]